MITFRKRDFIIPILIVMCMGYVVGKGLGCVFSKIKVTVKVGE
jgi:hypothetical protein